jgi:hypothetical protein
MFKSLFRENPPMRGMHLFLVLASLFLLFGCTDNTPQPSSPGEEGPTISVIGAETGEGGTNATAEFTDAQWAQKALDEQNAYYCLRVSMENQDACLLPLSNVSLQNCMMLGNYEMRKECLWRHARAQNDLSVCDMLRGGEVEACIIELSPPCTMEADEAARGRCYAFLTNNSAQCRDDECFFDFAVENEDFSACGGIQNTVKQAVCQGIVQGTNPCPGLTGSNKNLCYYMMALGKGTVNYCYNIDGLYESDIAYQCFLHFAVENQNKDLCTVLELNNRWNCFTNYSITMRDVSACQAIDARATISSNLCFDGFARNFYQASACNYLPYASVVQTNCYAFVVMASPELEFWDCNNVEVKEWRDRCFMNLADQKNDATYCGYIDDASMEQLCASSI